MTRTITIILVLLVLATASFSQVSDNAIEQMMSKRVLSADDVRLNMVSVIPRLHREHKQDTINAIINYYEKNYSTVTTILYYEMLVSIKNRTFKEELKNLRTIDEDKWNKLSDAEYYEQNIITYLWAYKEGCRIRQSSANYISETREAYASYYDFLRDLAVEEMNISGLSPVEKWLLVYFSTPSDTLYTVLSKHEYNGSRLRTAWLLYDKNSNSVTGFGSGVLSGAFIPTGNLSIVGVHPYFGFQIGAIVKKFTVDIDMNIRFLSTPQKYNYTYKSIPYSTNYYFGGYIGVDGGYQVWRKKKKEIDLLIGAAYDGFDTNPGSNNNSNNNNNDHPPSVSSLNVNFGIGYKFLLKDHIRSAGHVFPYFAILAKYNILGYNNPGGSDLTGNAFTIGIVYGGYNTKRTGHTITNATKKTQKKPMHSNE